MNRLYFAIVAATLLLAAPGLATGTALAGGGELVIVPGKSFGKITPATKPAGLAGLFGKKNVRTGMLQPPHGDFPEQNGAVVFEGTPKEFEVFFEDGGRRIQWVIAARENSAWRTDAGIHIGMDLAALEKVLGGPVAISSFGTDGGGTVLAGKHPALRDLIVRLSYPEDLPAEDGAKLEGGEPFQSSDPAARRANLKVSILWWDIRR